jgi:hypothetical protein
MTTRIGSKTVIFSTSFLVGNDSEARIDVPIEGETLKLGITFASSGGERSGEWHHENGVVHFTFTGWNNSIGTCTVEPTKFAELGGKRLYLQLASHYIGEQNLAQLFVLMGD